MKETPIPFIPELVRAIMHGQKTQTRRVIKPDPKVVNQIYADACILTARILGGNNQRIRCPYGRPGDRLWVRHPFWRGGKGKNDQVWDEFTRMVRWQDGVEASLVELDLDEQGKHAMLKKKNARFMPKWAARLWLEITEIGVQRVQEISEADASAEGCPGLAFLPGPDGADGIAPRERFRELWDRINAERGYDWESNPWVWVVKFRRLTP